MTSARAIQPLMDRHYHYDTSPYAAMSAYAPQPYVDPYPPSPYTTSAYAAQLHPAYDPQNDPMGRRYSSPQMGYYDLITGEYRYRSENPNASPLLSNYAGETEPPMCENTCKCCQVKLPFNCLTISLITSLMLLMMFTVFKMILGTKTKTNVNMSLFEDMIWLMVIVTTVFLLLTIIRYAFLGPTSRLTNFDFCKRCRMINEMIDDRRTSINMKNVTYGVEQPNHYLGTGEEFV